MLASTCGATADEFLRRFNPSLQAAYCQSPEKCFSAALPSLAAADRAYGRGTGEAWISAQLYNLAEYAGVRDKLSPQQAAELSAVIRARYGHYKPTELMLFFFRFKSGCYGRFYGSVDPMVITEGLLRFSAERAEAISKAEGERARAEADAARANRATREQFEEIARFYGYDPDNFMAQTGAGCGDPKK